MNYAVRSGDVRRGDRCVTDHGAAARGADGQRLTVEHQDFGEARNFRGRVLARNDVVLKQGGELVQVAENRVEFVRGERLDRFVRRRQNGIRTAARELLS